ncbi:MAG TPA: excinuclease ABC subunit UvrC [Anaerohalosphaeraceae bacterium]|nr:excinuclease ABC subunit UvrC [Anaerohalosphaeraceae bacterium]
MALSEDKLQALREKIRTFPTGPGLYFMKDAEEKVLYIGKGKNLRARVSSYFQPGANLAETRGPWIAEMLSRVADVDYLETAGEAEAILQEARLIKDIHPPYNTDLKDSKTFPYLEITTREDFPGVYITRSPNPRSRLFGPFTAVRDLRQVLGILQKIFLFRTCTLEIRSDDPKRRFFRPCLLYHIRQCTAPCADKVSREDYRRQIRDLIRFLGSKRSSYIEGLRRRMQEASRRQDFEEAARLRDRIRLLENLDKRGTVEEHVQPEVFFQDPTEALEKLQHLLKSPQPIRIIEGFDIAHLAGSETVGAMVQFIDGKPFKEGYRRFRIRAAGSSDDFAAIAEVISRRYKHALAGEELWPDLVLIDGGLGQLHAAEEALRSMGAPMPNLAAIAKREELIYLPGRAEPLRLSAVSPVRKLLQYVRDEAHRFAQHYHHILRRKKMLEEE